MTESTSVIGSWDTFFGAPSLSDLLSDLEAGGAEVAAMQERETGSTAGIALWESDLDAICLVCLIGGAYLHKLADSLGLEQLKL